MATIREATRLDFQEFYGVPPPFTVRALCAETSTGICGFGGYYLLDGCAFVFTDVTDAMKKRDIVRGAHAVMDMVRDSSLPAIAGGELTHGDAGLRHFGFKPLATIGGQPLYQLED